MCWVAVAWPAFHPYTPTRRCTCRGTYRVSVHLQRRDMLSMIRPARLVLLRQGSSVVASLLFNLLFVFSTPTCPNDDDHANDDHAASPTSTCVHVQYRRVCKNGDTVHAGDQTRRSEMPPPKNHLRMTSACFCMYPNVRVTNPAPRRSARVVTLPVTRQRHGSPLHTE